MHSRATFFLPSRFARKLDASQSSLNQSVFPPPCSSAISSGTLPFIPSRFARKLDKGLSFTCHLFLPYPKTRPINVYRSKPNCALEPPQASTNAKKQDATPGPSTRKLRCRKAQKAPASRSAQVFVCQWDECPGEQFLDKEDLTTHIETQHGLQRSNLPLEVELRCLWKGCTAKTPLHSSPMRHVLAHEVTYPCPFKGCSTERARLNEINVHMKSSHGGYCGLKVKPVPKRRIN
ncbi:hypothetical protein CPC08DRAFT_380889 [Agrocybe pediades]|nr:hypothetical protein CPC08DRAFT_380889 [Agrocybe pediades]